MRLRFRAALIISICVVLLALVWFQFQRGEVYSKDSKVRVQLKMLSEELRDYAAGKGAFPNQADGLQALVRSGQLNPEGLRDPWGKEITYRCLDSNCAAVRLISTGERDTPDAFTLDIRSAK
jgi:type II secretory pathway pseudopilin PulG